MKFVAGSLRFVGAFHTGVGISLLPPSGTTPPWAAYLFGSGCMGATGARVYVALGVLCALMVLALTWELEEQRSLRDTVLAGYMFPVGFALSAHLFFVFPTAWVDAGDVLDRFVLDVLSGTPLWAYLGGVGFGAFRAHEAVYERSDDHLYR